MKYRQISFLSRLGLGRAAHDSVEVYEAPPEGDAPMLRRPEDAIAYFQDTGMQFAEQEQMWVIGLDISMHLRFIEMVYQGTAHSTISSARDLFRRAIRESCTAVFIAHNHPSGLVRPSPDDVMVTKMLQMSGWLLGVEVTDCFILAGSNWLSMKQHGMMLMEEPSINTILAKLV